jgi:hypothetical protein
MRAGPESAPWGVQLAQLHCFFGWPPHLLSGSGSGSRRGLRCWRWLVIVPRREGPAVRRGQVTLGIFQASCDARPSRDLVGEPSAANPDVSAGGQAPARADAVAIPAAIPEMTPASADKTASAADVHSAAATAAARLHRTAAAAASRVAPGAADMHRATGMHPAAATTTAATAAATTAMRGERNRRDEKACCNCGDQRRFT